MRAARSEVRRCPHCHADYLTARPASRRGRTIAVYAAPDPLLGDLAVTRDHFGVWRWRKPEPGERVNPPEEMHLEHRNPCPRAPEAPTASPAPAQRLVRPVPAVLPPGVISLDQARQERAQRPRRGR